jgi:hypothetical protein
MRSGCGRGRAWLERVRSKRDGDARSGCLGNWFGEEPGKWMDIFGETVYGDSEEE